jgi:hypothetical protein
MEPAMKRITESDTPTDARDIPLDFVLTPRERDIAMTGQLYLEHRRRRQNEQDMGRDAARELESVQWDGRS